MSPTHNPFSLPENTKLHRALSTGFLLLAVLMGEAAAQTPLPDPKNESAWPGRGPIRVFPWMEGRRQQFWKNREKDRGAIVFAGSSMIENWKTLAADLPELKTANRGIGGDVSRGLLFRFQEDVLDLKPRAIVIAIGSNDLSAHTDPALIIENITALIEQARTADPKVPILLCPVAPRDGTVAPLRPGAREDFNARLAELGKKSGIPVMELEAHFAGPDGVLVAEYYAKDRIHFSAAGYQKLAAVMKQQIATMSIP